MKKLEIKITWENNNSFEMKSKGEGDTEWTTVVMIEENGELDAILPHAKKACMAFLDSRLEAINNEMRKV